MALISIIAYIIVMVGLTTLLLSVFYPIARNYSDSADINEAVRSIHHSALSNYKLEVLKTRCFHEPTLTTLADLVAYNPTIKPLVLDRKWQFTFDYQINNTPYPHPIRLDVSVLFDSSDELNNVFQYLTPQTSTDQVMTFSYPVTSKVSNYEQFDRSTGCIH